MRGKRIVISSLFILILFCSFIFLYLPSKYVLPILMYHRIDENAALTKLSVSPPSFARQMDFLFRHNYNVVSLEKAVRLIKSGKIPYKTLAITFDDGYENNFTHAYRVLKQYDFPATIFVITDSVGKENFLSWTQMKTVLNTSRINIGSHTRTHAWLPGLDEEELRKEIIGSKRILEEKLQQEIKFICYPLGGVDEEVKRVVRQAGYYGGCATNSGKNSPASDVYALKRVRISRTSDNLLTFWIETSGFYTWIKEIRDEP